MILRTFYFENGISGGYYIEYPKGVNWAVQPTKQLALDWYNKLQNTSFQLTDLKTN